MSAHSQPWTHKSIRRLAGTADPVATILQVARATVLRAMDSGWTGPPFDPIALAEIMRIEVTPRDDVRDARVVPVGREGVRIEFNPSRPPNRVRYSIAHEIAHTFFPDCGERIRHRATSTEMKGDEWQLEALCNIAAAELLMPAGSLPALTPDALEIRSLMNLRERFAVSTEALLIRVAKSAEQVSCAAFCASRVTHGEAAGRIRLDYVIGSPRWKVPLSRGILLPTKTALRDCVAIGYTASATENWGESPLLQVEGVAIPAYPGDTDPRVVGIISTRGQRPEAQPMVRYVRGDATKPRGERPGIVAQVVNDATANWGGAGFASAVRRTWPAAQTDFRDWARERGGRLTLGTSRLSSVSERVQVFSMIAQRGYGASSKPRIRYEALEKCLLELGTIAARTHCIVHVPRIGAGQAGGSWDVVHDMILECVCSQGVEVVVYDLPGAVPPVTEQQPLGLGFRSRS